MRAKHDYWSHFQPESPVGASKGTRRCKYCRVSVQKSLLHAKAHFLEAHFVPETERVRAALVAEVQRLGGALPSGSLDLQYMQHQNMQQSEKQQPVLLSLQSSFSRASQCDDDAAAVFGQLVASALVHTDIAAEKMDDPHWKHLFRFMQPQLPPPSRADLLGKHLDTLFARSRARLESWLARAKYIGATTTIWTDTHLQTFQDVNATFVDDNFVLQTLTLDVIEMPDMHAGDFVADQLSASAEEFDITSRILSITTDGVRDYGSMAAVLEIAHIRSIADKLRLVVADVLLPVRGTKGVKVVPPDPYADEYAAVLAKLDASSAGMPSSEPEAEAESAQGPSWSQQPTARFAESSIVTPALKALLSLRQTDDDAAASGLEDSNDEDEAERYASLAVVETFTKLCVTFTGSVELKRNVLDIIKEDDIKEKAMACRYGDTRWTSILWMFAPLVRHETLLRRLLEDNQLGHQCPSPFDFARARILCSLLQPMATATETLQTSLVATHLVVPMLRDMMSRLHPDKTVPTDEELSVPSAVLGQLDMCALARFREQMKHLLRSNLAAMIRSMSDAERAVFDTADFFNPKRAATSLTMRQVGLGQLAERGLRCDEKAETIIDNLSVLGMAEALYDTLPEPNQDVVDDMAGRTDVIISEDLLSFPRRTVLKKALVEFARTAPRSTMPTDDFSSPGNLERWWSTQEADRAFPPAVFDAARCIFAVRAAPSSSERTSGKIVSAHRTSDTLKKAAIVQSVGAAPRHTRKRRRPDAVTFARHRDGHDLVDAQT